jgi:glycosyltransferase involved in cell wall biosynthesis
MGFANRLLSDKIIAVAESAKQNLIDMGILGSQIEVIINGASPLTQLTNDQKQKIKERLGISDAFAVVSICARLEKCKDHVTFLRAAAILSKLDAKYSFLVIGDGSLRPYLKNCAKKLGIEDKVIFTGFVEDTSPYMNVTDINVNCSIGTETSSLAISEGMSLGIPCVASDYGGNPYMVENGVNGYIFEMAEEKNIWILDMAKIFADSEGKLPEEFTTNGIRFEKDTYELWSDFILKHKAH